MTHDLPGTRGRNSTYGYARLAEEADYDMASRPAVRAWRERVEALPGWAAPATLLPV